MSKTDLAAIEFGPVDLRTLEEISVQLGACKTASEQKSGPGRGSPSVLSIFLRMVDEKLSGFVKELKERMKTKATTTT
jgi:hypothetical protein